MNFLVGTYKLICHPKYSLWRTSKCCEYDSHLTCFFSSCKQKQNWVSTDWIMWLAYSINSVTCAEFTVALEIWNIFSIYYKKCVLNLGGLNIQTQSCSEFGEKTNYNSKVFWCFVFTLCWWIFFACGKKVLFTYICITTWKFRGRLWASFRFHPNWTAVFLRYWYVLS